MPTIFATPFFELVVLGWLERIQPLNPHQYQTGGGVEYAEVPPVSRRSPCGRGVGNLNTISDTVRNGGIYAKRFTTRIHESSVCVGRWRVGCGVFLQGPARASAGVRCGQRVRPRRGADAEHRGDGALLSRAGIPRERRVANL